jgi:Pentapeptide repeats (8 copies)
MFPWIGCMANAGPWRIAVASTNVNFTFQVPSDEQGPVGKIRLRVGSLGVNSNNEADLRGANFTGANMDGLDMREGNYTTSGGEFEQIYTGYQNKKVPVAFKFGAPLLGNTTSGTTCPNGQSGPCSL